VIIARRSFTDFFDSVLYEIASDYD